MEKIFRPAALFSVFLISAAWPAHAATEEYHPGEYCPVCSVVCSPELNSDCGTELVPRPVDFVFVAPETGELPAGIEFSPVFLGRAPPLS